MKPQPGELDVSRAAQSDAAAPLVARPQEQVPNLPPRPPVTRATATDDPQREGTASSESELEAIAGVVAPTEYDPYSLLANAFCDLADQPQPTHAMNQL